MARLATRLPFAAADPWEHSGPEVNQMPTWAWVLIIVLLVLLVFGGFGYSRR
jgi:hypothetical protein